MTALWPAVSALGFVLVVGLVIVLGRSTTRSHDVERERAATRSRQVPAPAPFGVPDAVDAGAAHPGDLAHTSAARGHEVPDQAAAARAVERQGTAGSVATMPQVRPAVRPADAGSAPAWWLVTESDHQVLSGPFADRVEADWAVLAGAGDEPVHSVYGVRRPDGGVVRRQTPEDLAWLAELGDQLDRLPREWDEELSDDDPMVTLAVELAAALVESGIPLHDCAGDGAAGGVCLTPEPGSAGVLVSWHQHDRMSRDLVRGADAVTAVQRTMNAAVAECLEQLGFLVAPVGSAGCSLVIDARPER